jgi:hypothetical protein
MVHWTACVEQNVFFRTAGCSSYKKHKCRLSAVICIRYAACWRFPSSTKFKLQSPISLQGLPIEHTSITFVTRYEARNLILKLLRKVTRHPVYQTCDKPRPCAHYYQGTIKNSPFCWGCRKTGRTPPHLPRVVMLPPLYSSLVAIPLQRTLVKMNHLLHPCTLGCFA